MQLFKDAGLQTYLHTPIINYRQRKMSATKSYTKDYFSNNKKFCQLLSDVISSLGYDVSCTEEYYVTCAKYFIYGMVNLKAFCQGNIVKAKGILREKIKDPFYINVFTQIKNTELKKYGYSKRLITAIDAARKGKLNNLLVYAWLTDYRAKISELQPIKKQRKFP